MNILVVGVVVVARGKRKKMLILVIISMVYAYLHGVGKL